MRALAVVAALLAAANAIDVPVRRNCSALLPAAGLANNYHENVAHAVHSMNVPGLRRFNPRATVHNSVPTVNLDVSSPNKVCARETMFFFSLLGKKAKVACPPCRVLSPTKNVAT